MEELLSDKSYLEQQLAEIELLTSMYPAEGEIILDKPSVIDDVKRYISGEGTAIPKQIAVTVKLVLDTTKPSQDVFLWTSLPITYPHDLPEIFARCASLSREKQALLNQRLVQCLTDQVKGEPCLTAALMWLQENAAEYITEDEELTANNTSPKCKFTGLSRLWIYSHHIYRKELLKKIPGAAAELDLTGFVLPGKPGIICVEGMKERCDEYWQRLKYPNWKHISCKHREDKDLNHDTSVDSQLGQFRIFEIFEELAFEAHGDYGLRNDYHMDLGQFKRYLESHNCDYMFQIFFGLEGK